MELKYGSHELSAFKQILCRPSATDLTKFYPLVETRLQIFGDMTCLHKTFDTFIGNAKTFPDTKWLLFKLMLSFDLFGIIDVLYLSSQGLKDYIDRLYQPYHYTSLKSDKNNFDDPERIVDQIIQQSYRQSRISCLLQVIIGLHLDIKQQSLVSQHFNQQKVLKKYQTINKYIQQIHIIILKRHMKEQDFNQQIKNNQNQFLIAYYNTTDTFKQSLQDFRLILEYQQLLYEFCQINSAEKNKTLVNQKIKQMRIMKMLKLIQFFDNKFKEKKKQEKQIDQVIPKLNVQQSSQQKQKSAKRWKKKDQSPNKPAVTTQIFKLEQEYEKLIKIFMKEYKQQPFEIIELLKLNMVKYIIEKVKIRYDDVSLFGYFIKLKLFNSKISQSLWNALKDPINNIIKCIKSADAADLIQQQHPLVQFKKIKIFEQQQALHCHFQAIDSIFKEVDLLIASQICGSWKQSTQISDTNKVLVIGKTKAGKSSLLNFLSMKKNLMDIGNTLVSKTFYPEWVNIKIDDEDWEWWDLPGLMDTRSFIFRLCIGFFLKCIVDSSNRSKIKFVLVSKNYELYDVQSYSKTIKLFGNLLQWKSQNVSSLSVIYTHILALKNIEQLNDSEMNKINKTSPQVFLQKIRPIPKLSEQNLSQFYQALLKQVFQNIQFFTFDDNNSPTQQSQSRQGILTTVKQSSSVQNISVEPIIFLIQEQSDFLQHFNIEFRAKQYLDPKKQDSNQLFLKLFTIIQSFRTINIESIKNQFKFLKQKLKRQYQSGIHDSFVKLNQLNVEENKNSQAVNSIINQILKYHFTSYFVSFQQKMKRILEDIEAQKCQIIIGKTLQYITNPKISLQNEIKIMLQDQCDNKKIKQISLKMITQADKYRENGKKFEQQSVIILLQYLKNLVNFKDRQIMSAMQNANTIVSDLQKKLLKTNLRQQYKSIFNQNNIKVKLNKFFKLKQGNYIETTLLQVVEDLFNENKNNRASIKPQMMVEHFLQLLSKDNYQSNLKIDHRYNRLFPEDKIQNSAKLLRLDIYGQCISNKQVYFSDFLKINTIQGKKKSCEEQTVYVFSEYSSIKIYCKKIIFDMEKINIKCKESFSIIANQIEFKYEEHSIKAVKFNYQPATVIVILQKNDQQYENQHKVRMGKLFGKLEINQKQDKKFCNQSEKILYIQNHGTLVSRTGIEAAVYLQMFYYDPNYAYSFNQTKDIIHKRNILKIKTPLSFKTRRPLEFGELHLKRLIQLKIQKSRKKQNGAVTSQQFSKLGIICHQVIQYIINRFERTTIRLKYEHFNTIFCKKMSSHIFDIMKDNKNISIDSINKSCFRMMKQQMFGHIYVAIINILESDYNKNYGRHYSSRKIQSQSMQIKRYCQSLLQMPLHRFEKHHQQQHLSALTKKFTLRFQKNMYYTLQQRMSFKGIMMGFVYFFVNPNETEQQKSQKLISDQKYIQTTVKKLKNLQSFLVDQQKQKSKSKQSLNQSKYENNIIETNVQEVQDNFQINRKQAELLCQNYEFSELIKKFQYSDMNIFIGKQDQIHSYIGYAYMKKRMYKQAANQFKLLSAESQSSDKHKIIFDVLKRKYNSIFAVTTKSEDQVSTKTKKINIIEDETAKVLQSPFKYDSRSSLIRFNHRQREFYNILSLDSAKFQNHIVNIIFAAEIEKCTRRPIMHMFDMIICKNSSALLGAALAIPMRTQRDVTYGTKIFPQFAAWEFIKSSSSVLHGLDEQMNIKTKFKPSDYDFRSLHTSLAFMIQNEKKQIITTFNYAQTTSRNCRTIYDIVSRTVSNSKKQTQVDPLFHIYGEQSIPAFKSDRTIDLVSLGTGMYYSQRKNEFYKSRNTSRVNKFTRWQLYLDDYDKMDELKVEDYIQLARMTIQQKWINQTKDMRDLMDKLEDRPTIKAMKKKY